MSFDFDKLIRRRGSACVKWDALPPFDEAIDTSDVIPMWVADMDFEVAPCISKAVIERAMNTVYGYNIVPSECGEAICSWLSSRHSLQVDPSWILYTTGVVPAMSTVIRAMTHPGEKVVIFTPAYNCFFRTIKNNGCEVAECPLVYADRTYTIDFDLFERICADPACTLLLFCNPHNPAGRVWKEEELLKIAEICRRHSVHVVSDEIHCEIVMPGHHYIPFASLSEQIRHECITMNSYSKAFNAAGLKFAYIITDNPLWRSRIAKAIDVMEIGGFNPFGQLALRAAYSEEGARWLDELNEYIYGNYQLMSRIFEERLPQFPLCRLEGTYLAWFDCSALGDMPSVEIEKSLLVNEKVWVNNGTMYGKDGFIRVNLAAPRSLVAEGLRRLADGLERLLSERL